MNKKIVKKMKRILALKGNEQRKTFINRINKIKSILFSLEA